MSQVFNAYAAYYDLLYRDKDYAAEADYVAGLVRQFAPEARTILDLGCGTGTHAALLAAMGFTVHGVDFSPAMVERAEARKAELPSEVAERMSFACGDVRDYRHPGRFDAVLSLFHVMSYQTSNGDLTAAFATAAEHLAPGGVFLFDYWYGPAVLTQQPEVRVKRMEDERIRVLRIAEPELAFGQNRVRVNYTVQVEEKSSDARGVVTEHHDMRYFFLPEVELLANPAFRTLAHQAWMAAREPGVEDWAAVSVLERKA